MDFAVDAVMMEYPLSTADTTSTPTNTARPVETVRLGERSALATARFPVWERITEPNTRISGGNSHGRSKNTATPKSNAATMTNSTPALLCCAPASGALVRLSDCQTAAAPATAAIRPRIRPTMPGFFTAWAVPSPKALMGEIFRALRAGASDATTVTSVQTTTPTTNASGLYETMKSLNSTPTSAATG